MLRCTGTTGYRLSSLSSPSWRGISATSPSSCRGELFEAAALGCRGNRFISSSSGARRSQAKDKARVVVGSASWFETTLSAPSPRRTMDTGRLPAIAAVARAMRLRRRHHNLRRIRQDRALRVAGDDALDADRRARRIAGEIAGKHTVVAEITLVVTAVEKPERRGVAIADHGPSAALLRGRWRCGCHGQQRCEQKCGPHHPCVAGDHGLMVPQSPFQPVSFPLRNCRYSPSLRLDRAAPLTLGSAIRSSLPVLPRT